MSCSACIPARYAMPDTDTACGASFLWEMVLVLPHVPPGQLPGQRVHSLCHIQD